MVLYPRCSRWWWGSSWRLWPTAAGDALTSDLWDLTSASMIIHLVDGTYELFRHFYGIRRFKKTDPPLGAVAGVLGTLVKMLEDGATHIGVATDHVIESFRNDLWPDYKTGAGIEPALLAQ